MEMVEELVCFTITSMSSNKLPTTITFKVPLCFHFIITSIQSFQWSYLFKTQCENGAAAEPNVPIRVGTKVRLDAVPKSRFVIEGDEADKIANVEVTQANGLLLTYINSNTAGII